MSVSEGTPATTTEGRDSNGRFAKGNHGGPGNPFARRVAELRSALLDTVTAEDIQEIVAKLVELAKAGDVAAARLLLQYTLGKPVEQPHPDRIDRDEYEAFRANAVPADAFATVDSTPVGPTLLAMRELMPCRAEKFAQGLAQGLRAQAAQERAEAEKAQAEAAVTKRGKPAQPATVSAHPASPTTEAEAPRLTGEERQADRRAANTRRS